MQAPVAVSRRQGRHGGDALRQRQRLSALDVVAHVAWQSRPSRDFLRRVMITVAKWKAPPLGTDRDYTLLCAAVVLVMGKDGGLRGAFRAIVGIHEMLALDDYYMPRRQTAASASAANMSCDAAASAADWLRVDAECVWRAAEALLPEATSVFADREELFFMLVEHWLLSLFSGSLASKRRATIWPSVPLLRRSMTLCGAGGSFVAVGAPCWTCCRFGIPGLGDPRAALRSVAACVLCRSASELQRCGADEVRFRAKVECLRGDVAVDDALLELIDLGTSPLFCQAVEVAALLPPAGVAGWLGGVSLCGWIAAATVTAPHPAAIGVIAAAWLPGCAVAGAASAALCCGAAVAFGLRSGHSFFQQAFVDVAATPWQLPPPAG